MSVTNFSKKINNKFIEFLECDFSHRDNRGMLVQLVSKNKWSQVNYIESEVGSLRGNHYHKINQELFYVIEGSFNLKLESKNNTIFYNIQKGDMFIIKPLVKHSFEYLAHTKLITMYDKGVELEDNKMDIFT